MTSSLPDGGPATFADDDDPVVATYRVFIKPQLKDNRELVIFKFPTKTAMDPSTITPPKIQEVRMKPQSGIIEVDEPVNTQNSYDRKKGIAWGVALAKSMEDKKGGSLGLAGGFGIGAPPPSQAARGRGRNAGEEEEPLTWAEASRQNKVLRTQTYSGSRSRDEWTQNMVAVFKGKNIHFTPISSMVMLRPVAHHIDAAAEQERLSRPNPAVTSGPGQAGDKGAAGRAIQMTIKSAQDGVATETFADRLRKVRAEPWQHMDWVHDEAEGAWDVYNECLLMRTTGTNSTTGDGDEKVHEEGKGKGKEAASDEAAQDDSGSPDLVDRVPHLKTNWGEEEMVRALNKRRNGRKE
ncbi:DNA-directed RNA polymerase [Podospora australis]|uniref:DNA-directed RNA polymerase n=1 Tax=Podospora australis TaxID=1536484 RepID=A0AAN6WTY9_9PEZI|nr:DNA-directed RNA polymerase [Podospora australis]